jgi:hypothetical protein
MLQVFTEVALNEIPLGVQVTAQSGPRVRNESYKETLLTMWMELLSGIYADALRAV